MPRSLGQAGRTGGREERSRTQVGRVPPRGDPYLDGVVFKVAVVFHLFKEIVDVFVRLSQLF